MIGKIKVIIADSDEILCQQFKEYMSQQKDVEVIAVCKNGYAVLEAVEKQHPDMLILDLIMPGLDGIGVLERLRQENRLPDVIVTSVLDNSKLISCACALGVDFYICKPYDMTAIHERIVQICGKVSYSAFSTVKPGTQRKIVSKNMESEKYSLEVEVTTAIRELGIPAHIKGYQYIRESILLALKDANMLSYITKYLYPTIAKKYNTTSSSVERAIRHAIGVAWERGNGKELKDLYGYHYTQGKDRPTNSEFLSLIVDRFRMEQEEKQGDHTFSSKVV